MVSDRQRGTQRELRAKEELEAMGFLVERARGQIVWIGRGRPITKAVDLFGAFDLIAVNPDEVHAIQVTGDDAGGASRRRKKIDEVAPRLPGTWSLELWRWCGRAGWWKESLLPKGWTTFERKGHPE